MSAALDDLVRQLDRHVAADAGEAASLRTMRELARSLPAPLSRDQPGAHFTASALVVDRERRRTLLVLHRKIGRWLQPGGHVEPGDAGLLAAAVREAGEETGLAVVPERPEPLDVDVHEIPARGDAAAHLHLDVRFLVLAEGEASADPGETAAAAWLGRAEALARADAGLRRLIEKGLSA